MALQPGLSFLQFEFEFVVQVAQLVPGAVDGADLPHEVPAVLLELLGEVDLVEDVLQRLLLVEDGRQLLLLLLLQAALPHEAVLVLRLVHLHDFVVLEQSVIFVHLVFHVISCIYKIECEFSIAALVSSLRKFI